MRAAHEGRILARNGFLIAVAIERPRGHLATRGGGQGLKIYRRLERDAKVGSCLGKRYDAQAGTAYLIRPDQHITARWRAFAPGAVTAAVSRATGRA